MQRALPHSSSAAVLLGLSGLGAAALVLLAGAARTPRAAAVSSVAAAVAGSGEDVATGIGPVGREVVLAGPRPSSPGANATAEPRSLGAQKERELLAGFLELERARPGSLVARAADVLAGDGPAAEKVALLRALHDAGSQEHLQWLEHAVRTLPDDSGPHGVSVARFALGVLADAAAAEPEARARLARLAFETHGLAADLRRTAAVALARAADDVDLGRLRVYLARESDALLVSGAVAALRERRESPLAERIAAELGVPGEMDS